MALPVTQYGGQLPISAWPKADALVQSAWKVYIDLDKRVRPKITDRTSYLTGALATFKKNVERFSEQTERLKHGPPFDSENVIRDYLTWGTQFEGWAKEIDKTADYGSTWGAWKEISFGIIRDAADFAYSLGQGAKAGVESVFGALKYLPYIAVALGAIYVFGKSRR